LGDSASRARLTGTCRPRMHRGIDVYVERPVIWLQLISAKRHLELAYRYTAG